MAIAQDLLRNFLRAPRWRIIFDERYLSARKRLAAGIGIFDRVEEGDREKANEILEIRKKQYHERRRQIEEMTETGDKEIP